MTGLRRRAPVLAVAGLLLACNAQPASAPQSGAGHGANAAGVPSKPVAWTDLTYGPAQDGWDKRGTARPAAVATPSVADPEDARRAGPQATPRPPIELAQGPREITPERAAELQAALARAVGAQGLPGATVAMALPDGSTWLGATGVADLGTGVPMTPDTAFNIASITKTFIAVLTVQLAEDGVLSLDDPVSRWLSGIPNGDRATIRNLLGHTSGIADFLRDDPRVIDALLADPWRFWTPQEVLGYVAVPYADPGSRWKYSNSNYLILGLVIQNATGRSVGEELRARILGPLGLGATFLQPDEVPVGALAGGHTVVRDIDADGLPDRTAVGGPYWPDTAWASSVWTAGAGVSNAPDLLRWSDALFGGEVVEPASLDAMLRFDAEGNYGLGIWRKTLDGRTGWGHSGLLRGYTSLMLYFPADHLTVVVLTNRDGVRLDELLLERYGGERSLFEIALAAGAD